MPALYMMRGELVSRCAKERKEEHMPNGDELLQ